MRRFDDRVLELMARHIDVPLALANLAARDKVSAAALHPQRPLFYWFQMPSERVSPKALPSDRLECVTPVS
jgi:hypothetical protein